jgi:uncharacterized pyridoxamine 5'-phosphate oxidase family protein
MERLTNEIIQFLQNQSFVIVSTIDKKGMPHNSCKGIIKINPKGLIYLLDVYKGKTYNNLKRNSKISLTAVDEHKFKGYCLKGKAKIILRKRLRSEILRAWQDRITSRLTQRLIRNIRGEKGHFRHPEILLPKPEYMILMEVKEIVDLTPSHIRQE